tara:strand:- start:6653 stop:7009 length:357 start_codon:yes stop_codon:yes gene_type:complete
MYKPLPKSLTIRQSRIHGLGLFAVETIYKDTDLGISHVYHPDFPHEWMRTPLGGFYNHSNINFNCKLKFTYVGVAEWRVPGRKLIAIKDIESGQEITCKYTLWDSQTLEGDKEDWLGL